MTGSSGPERPGSAASGTLEPRVVGVSVPAVAVTRRDRFDLVQGPRMVGVFVPVSAVTGPGMVPGGSVGGPGWGLLAGVGVFGVAGPVVVVGVRAVGAVVVGVGRVRRGVGGSRWWFGRRRRGGLGGGRGCVSVWAAQWVQPWSRAARMRRWASEALRLRPRARLVQSALKTAAVDLGVEGFLSEEFGR